MIARLLRADGWDIVTMREHYGTAGDTLADVDWIADQSRSGRSILTCDAMILSNPPERQAVIDNGGRVFVLPTSQLTGPAQAERFIRHRASIYIRAVGEAPAGFVVYETRISRALP